MVVLKYEDTIVSCLICYDASKTTVAFPQNSRTECNKDKITYFLNDDVGTVYV